GAIVASSSGLYYTTYVVQDSRVGQFLDGSVMHVPFAGGEPTRIASGELFKKPLMTTTTLILAGSPLPTSHGDVITFIPFSNGPTTRIAMRDGDVLNGVATDGTFVYFASFMGGLQAVPVGEEAGIAGAITLAPGFPNVIGAFGEHLIVAGAQG